jgi:hypothetical protein
LQGLVLIPLLMSFPAKPLCFARPPVDSDF